MNKYKKIIASGTAVIMLLLNNFAIVPDKNNSLSEKEKSSGWKLLFDGKTTAGWHLYNSTAPFTVWKVADGEIFCDPNDKSGVGDLVTDKEYANYDLKFEWKLPKGGNSGVFVNVLEQKEIPAAWASGPEYQLLEDSNVDFAKPKSRSGCLYSFAVQKNTVKSRPAGKWNQSEIKQTNGKVTFYLNGKITAIQDFKSKDWQGKISKTYFKNFPAFGKQIKGKIALQDWATGVSFRNIKIKEL